MKHLVLLILVFFYQCGGDNTPATFLRTPKGATIVSATAIPPDLAIIVDSQLDTLFEKAIARGYSGFTRHNSYRIKLVKAADFCDRYSFAVSGTCENCWGQPNCNCYDGSEYDHDPNSNKFTICAAGRYLPNEDIIEIPETAIRETEALVYEGEHKVLKQVDPIKYVNTLTHGTGTGHPLF